MKKSFVCIHHSLYQQGDQIEKIDKNPTVFVNPAQPLMASVEVSSTRVKFFPTNFVFNDFLFDQFQTQVDDKEIVAQEERVKEARDRLASAIKALS